jgi:HD-GYP domain-containing protein (c-di-GMP phosphodiesterase class II)
MDSLQEMRYFIEKANRAAEHKDWLTLAEKTLELLQEVCQAEAVLLYPPSGAQGKAEGVVYEEQPAPWRGCPQSISPAWWAALRRKLLQAPLFYGGQPRWIDRDTAIPEREVAVAFANLPSLRNLLILPLRHSEGMASGVLLVNANSARLDLGALVASRLATDLEKASELERIRRRETRLMALNEILGQMGASLNPDQVLRIFIERARQFLNVEAVSLFLVDEKSGDLVLQMASQANKAIQVEKVRVPRGQGIIGRVTQTGETLLVEDAKQDQRHYDQVDQISGFFTRSILAVPMLSRSIDLGMGRGTAQERIIGGLEAINKIGGGFKSEDVELLKILARGASTILVVAQLYENANRVFFDVVHALVGAIDAKDPHTVGHSQRVSDYATEIARHLGLPEEEVYQARMSALFHDVDKNGLPDDLLRRTGSMKRDALERLREQDPNGETKTSPLLDAEEELPLISRVISVADVFDAMTSSRPYHQGAPVEHVFAFLRDNIGAHYDPQCVMALIQAYDQGTIQTQSERQQAAELARRAGFLSAPGASIPP